MAGKGSAKSRAAADAKRNRDDEKRSKALNVIAKTPTGKVTGPSITRSGYTWTGKWKVPAALVKKANPARFTSLQVYWLLDFDGKQQDISDLDVISNEKSTSNAQTFSEFKGNFGGYNGKKLERKAFYPVTGKKLDSICFKVRGIHGETVSGKKKSYYGPWTDLKKYPFTKPAKPKVTLSYDEGSQVLSYTIETDAGAGNAERYDTRYKVYVERSGMADLVLKDWKASTDTKITGSVDLNDAKVQWQTGGAVTAHVLAYARGLAGDSAQADSSFKAVWPAKPTIDKGNITVSQGRVRIPVTISKGTVTTSQLQRWKELAPDALPIGNDGWSAVEDGEDNGNADALYDLLIDAQSTPGLYTWYRVKVENTGFHDYSEPVRADMAGVFIAAPTAENDACGIVGGVVAADGGSVLLTVGYTEDDANTGTEVAWATESDALISTAQPSTFQFAWYDAESASEDWEHTAQVRISGLDPDSTYWIWARRYLEGDDKTTYTAWSNPYEITPASRTTAVALSGPVSGYVARGNDMPLSWAYDGGVEQLRWSAHHRDRPKLELASGEGSLCYGSIPAERFEGESSLPVYVTVVTGDGKSTDSNVVSVRVADAPTCEVCAPATLASQPARFEAYSNTATSELLCTCRCSSEGSGIDGEEPGGTRKQLPGDSIWTNAEEKPAWEAGTWGDTLLYARLAADAESAQSALDAATAAVAALAEDDPAYPDSLLAVAGAESALADARALLAAHAPGDAVYIAKVEIPAGRDFIDGGAYDIECCAQDPVSGLKSGLAVSSFDVAWRHQAPKPSDAITVTVNPVELTARVVLAQAENWAETDVYDLYRKLPAGYALIARDLPATATVVDRYPPFGPDAPLDYRVCTRTADGDLAFDDYPYELDANFVRIDWDGGFAELPWDTVIQHSYSKAFGRRGHADGRMPGYWDPFIEHDASFSLDLLRAGDLLDVNLVKEIGGIAGPCFARTPHGDAFQCNIDPSVKLSYDSALAPTTLDVKECALTADFMVTRGDISGG